jgi:hypothetical protein
MKKYTFIVSLLLFFTWGYNAYGQDQITVKATNSDISDNLDLKAVASIFGQSSDLEDFERRLNNADLGISNLDLNNDGYVDYLRVVEEYENDVMVVTIQAVLDQDIYQDVASIVVEKNNDGTHRVQVIGDTYIYGNNYVIEPVFVSTPPIFTIFGAVVFRTWVSPFYWNHYPVVYRHRVPVEPVVYRRTVVVHVDHRHHYRYEPRPMSQRVIVVHNRIHRNDFERNHPEHGFAKRHANVTNRHDLYRESPSQGYAKHPGKGNGNGHGNGQGNKYKNQQSSRPSNNVSTGNQRTPSQTRQSSSQPGRSSQGSAVQTRTTNSQKSEAQKSSPSRQASSGNATQGTRRQTQSGVSSTEKTQSRTQTQSTGTQSKERTRSSQQQNKENSSEGRR